MANEEQGRRGPKKTPEGQDAAVYRATRNQQIVADSASMTVGELAKKYGLTSQMVTIVLKKAGVKLVRGMSEPFRKTAKKMAVKDGMDPAEAEKIFAVS